jgi:hypothetical protein
MLRDVEVDDAPALVGEHDEDKEHPQARGGHREEVEGDQIPDMVGQKRPPGLRRRGAAFGDQSGDGALGHVEAQLPELPMDARGAPEGDWPRPCG